MLDTRLLPESALKRDALRLDCAAIQSDLKVQPGKRNGIEARRVQNRLLHHLCNAAEFQMT